MVISTSFWQRALPQKITPSCTSGLVVEFSSFYSVFVALQLYVFQTSMEFSLENSCKFSICFFILADARYRYVELQS